MLPKLKAFHEETCSPAYNYVEDSMEEGGKKKLEALMGFDDEAKPLDLDDLQMPNLATAITIGECL